MENKYTQGPWITEKSGRVIWIGPNAHRTNSKVGYIVTHIDVDPEYKAGVIEEKMANAKLIAAAPELLEALKDVINCQFNPTITLAGLNGAISNAQQLLHKLQL